MTSAIGDTATKVEFTNAINGATPLSLLVTATHGAGVDSGDPLQYAEQGALVCQDWQGLASTGPLTPNEYVTAHDIVTTKLPGTIAFSFACYGAGTPANEAFLPLEVTDAPHIAPKPFVARLAQQLLLSGAGAVIGHENGRGLVRFVGPVRARKYRCLPVLLMRWPPAHALATPWNTSTRAAVV